MYCDGNFYVLIWHATVWPKIWSNIILNASEWVFLDEINI